jgi:hypothetical protein
VDRIRRLVKAERKTIRGSLKGWWQGKYGGKVGEDFGKRTIGGLLREYYEDAAIELDRQRATLRTDGYNPEVEARIAELEALFSDNATDLQTLSDEESLEEWEKPRRTGDPKADEWEAAIARGETPNLED